MTGEKGGSSFTNTAAPTLPGRDPASLPVTIWGAKEDMAMLERDRALGVVRVIISLESAKADAILPELDRWAELIRKLG